VRWRAVSSLVDSEPPEVVIQPPHRGLNDTVQDLEGDRGRHLDLAPDYRVSVAQLDTNGGDLVEAVECSAASWRAHAASLAGGCFQFQGRSSASRAAGRSLIRRSESASHACGATSFNYAASNKGAHRN